MSLLPMGLIVDIRYHKHGWIKSNAIDAVWDGVRKAKTPKDDEIVKSRISDGFVKSPISRLANPEE